MNSIARLLAAYAAFSLLLCGLTHLEWSPLQPNGWGQWIAMFLLIVPAAATAELTGPRGRGPRIAPDSEASAMHADCSWARIAGGLLLFLATAGVVLGAAWWLAHPAAA